jgi:hypothetical protein
METLLELKKRIAVLEAELASVKADRDALVEAVRVQITFLSELKGVIPPPEEPAKQS